MAIATNNSGLRQGSQAYTMFRNCWSRTRTMMVQRSLPLLTPQEHTSGYTSNYDTRQNCSQAKNCSRPILLPTDQRLLTSRSLMLPASQALLPIKFNTISSGCLLASSKLYLQNSSSVRLASSGFKIPNPSEVACNFINMSRCVDLNDLKYASPPVFWVTFATVSAQLGIPLLELIGGYSPVLTYLQLYIATSHLAWSGGEKWGLASSGKDKPTWEVMNQALVPRGFAVLGLLLPYPLGFITVAIGLLTSLYSDLKSCSFPPWAIACKFLVALSSAVGLLLALMAYILFHNRQNSKSNGKEKKNQPVTEEKEEDDVSKDDKNK